jgi:hypothetical protein
MDMRTTLFVALIAGGAWNSNTHVIPADAYVRKQLSKLRVGEVVELTGTLVDGMRDDGVWFRTSLTRTDTGAGACEVMWVEHVRSVIP